MPAVGEPPRPADSSPGRRRRRARRQAGIVAVVALVVVTCDVITKTLAVAHLEGHAPVPLVGDLLTLTFVRNPGAAFGLAAGYTGVLAVVSIGVVLVLVKMASRLTSRGWAVALGLLLGGALGNLADRLFRAPGPLRGAVVDFIALPHWPVFNLADTAICCAAVLIVVLSFLGKQLDDGDGDTVADSEDTAAADESAAAGADRAEPDTTAGAEPQSGDRDGRGVRGDAPVGDGPDGRAL